MIRTEPNTWHDFHAASPTVIRDGTLFKMWFQGAGQKWSIGYAESTDGILWTVDNQSQIDVSSQNLSNGFEVVEPVVLHENSLYKMWFKETVQSGDNQIRYAESPDGLLWLVNPLPVLFKSDIPWESSGPTNPAVIYDDGEYKMWYVARGTGSWQIGYATSPDGIVWTRFPENPLNLPSLGFIGGPTVIKIENVYHMWYHTGSSLNTDIYHVTSQDGTSWFCEDSCSVMQTTANTFDAQGVTAPSVLINGDKLFMWYGGNNGTNWQIGLASEYVEPTPTPSTIPSRTPLVLIPGFMASWNKESLFYDIPVPQNQWLLSPFVHEYEGIVASLENVGYTLNKDLFVFTYDWRKSVSDAADDFNGFLNETVWNQNNSISIIGHSLGGLVARKWRENNPSSPVSQILTVGTPHLGTAQVYKPLEAGEIDRTDTTLWLLEKLVLELHRNFPETDKQTLQRELPVLKDLFPSYDFLYRPDNTVLSRSSLTIQNTAFGQLPQDSALFPVLSTYKGEKGNTLFGYTVDRRTALDSLLDFYPDGKPVSSKKQIGDYLILSQSAGIGNRIITLNKDHGEIIYSKEAISSIFDTLGISYQDNQIIEGGPTVISPSLIFMIKSPATISLKMNGQTYQEQNGIIFIPNPPTSQYTLSVKGLGPGNYQVLRAHITETNDDWTTLNGFIQKNNPDRQIDEYNFPITTSGLFEELKNYISVSSIKDKKKILDRLKTAQKYYTQKKYSKSRLETKKIAETACNLINSKKNSEEINQIIVLLSKLELLSTNIPEYELLKSSGLKLKLNIFLLHKKFNTRIQSLTKSKRKISQTQKALIEIIDKKLKNADENMVKKPQYAEALLISVQNLIKRI